MVYKKHEATLGTALIWSLNCEEFDDTSQPESISVIMWLDFNELCLLFFLRKSTDQSTGLYTARQCKAATLQGCMSYLTAEQAEICTSHNLFSTSTFNLSECCQMHSVCYIALTCQETGKCEPFGHVVASWCWPHRADPPSKYYNWGHVVEINIRFLSK